MFHNSFSPVGETSWSRFLPVARGPSEVSIRASERVSPALSSVKRGRFRSFRSYMSIAASVVLFSRSFRSLIKTRVDMAKHIKDLKDLSVLGRGAGYRH